MKGLILAGGHGTRLRPLTHTGPKQLIPIANKPNIQYCVEDLRNVGVMDIGVILGNNMPEKVRAFLGDGSNFGVNITYIEQGDPKGIAHAVKISKDFIENEDFIVYLGDNILKQDLDEMVQSFEESAADSAVALAHVLEPQRFGIAEIENDGEYNRITNLVEKPEHPISDLGIVGIYFFRPVIFESVDSIKPSWRGELELTDAIQELVNRGKLVHGYVVTDWWKDTGKPEDILEANHLVLDTLKPSNKGVIEDGASITGRVSIGEGTVIKGKSTIKGPVIIGKNCIIGPDSYIGPYTAIGDDTEIIGGETEDSIIIGNSVINCKKKIVASLIGENVKILSKDELMPKGYRAVVGENSMVWL
ncbi:glucose-1-phosphate thymidylyltransferase [Methanococcoides sp. SA1]|nr:glucose-1-phosphate thymidylyltransferase [Methanococcoides sp. SA1]